MDDDNNKKDDKIDKDKETHENETNKRRKITNDNNSTNIMGSNENAMHVENKLNMLEKLISVQSILENIDLSIQNHPENPKNTENNRNLANTEWGLLIQQDKDQKVWTMKGNSFTIGKSTKCNLCISDNYIPSSLARITYNYSSDVVYIEQRSRRLSVIVNNLPLVVGERKSMQDQDILSIGSGQKKISFKFEKSKSRPLSNSNPMDQNIEQQVEGGAPNLESSTPEFRKRKNTLMGGESLEKIFLVPERNMINNENINDRSHNVFEDISNIQEKSGGNQDHFAQFENSFLFDVLDEERVDSENFRNKIKEDVKKLFLDPMEIEDSLESFPYYIDPNTKQILLYSLYVFLSKPDFVPYTENLTPITRRILLQGMKGTTIYSEKLVRALAKHFNSKLVVVDSSRYPELFGQKTDKKETFEEDGTHGQIEELLRSDKKSRKSRKLFEKGDRVRFIGSETNKGPKFRDTGRVVIVLDDTKVRNIGVRWDKPVPGGHSLGKYCEKGRGFFVEIGNIQKEEFDNSCTSDIALNSLFELLEDKEYQPCIVYIPNCQEFMLENKEQYKHFKLLFKRLEEKTKGGSVIISCTETSDETGEPTGRGRAPQGMMISSKASTALLDFSLFDQLSKLDNDKSSLNKNQKLLKKMMPTTITLKPPSKPHQLSEWRAQIERDVKSLKKQNNLSLLTKLMTSNHLSCPFNKISASYLENYTLSTLDAHKIIGWALSHHIMNEHNHDPTLVISNNQINENNTNDEKVVVVDDVKKEEKVDNNNTNNEENDIDEKRDLEDDDVENTSRVVTNDMQDDPKLNDSSLLNDKDQSKQIDDEIVSINEKIGVIRKKEHVKVLEISLSSIVHAINVLSKSNQTSSSGKVTKLPEDANEFERRVMSEVISPDELNVRFEDIGALDNIKESIRELVILPLKRPELFRKGSLRKPCKGILLFGPPGTGKTMIAKAIATECRANFINISMSTIGSKWFGEGEKYAKAVFTLAYKIAPSIIFIDEVDSMLGKREKQGEHEAMRKIKNEFMSLWDGLKTQDKERVIVLGATNRPMDLDDAVLRRMPRRLLVDLPDALNREKILKVILKEENIEENFNFAELAKMTEGYTGSDLRNLCIAAAYIPVKEILSKEKNYLKVESEEDMSDDKEEEKADPEIRQLTLNDFVEAKKKISSSISEDSYSITQLRQWNEMYGEGGSKNPNSLSYFL